MKKVMSIAGVVLGVVTLGWWTRRQRRSARGRAGDESKERGREAWRQRRSQQQQDSSS